MAELTTPDNSKKNRRSLKVLPKVDLTAMVDLAFLLITFFMLTTSLSKDTAMHVAIPVGDDPVKIPDNRSLTICLGDKNKAVLYSGTTDNPQRIKVQNSNSIRRSLQAELNHIRKSSGKDAIVLVKPDSKSNFKNLVDVLDELEILDVSRYAIVETDAKDLQLLANSPSK
jgi:biopolymer transport protein ExbD